MRKRFGRIKDEIFDGKLFENKKSIKSMANKKLNRNILFGDEVYIDMYAGIETYKNKICFNGIIETYTSDSKPGEFKFYGFVANDVEFITYNNLSEFAENNNLELITEQWETSDTTEVKVDTGYGELRMKYKVSPSTTEQCKGFEWINLGLKKVK